MPVRICPTCETVQTGARGACEHCLDQPGDDGWLGPDDLADPWLGRELDRGWLAVQRLNGPGHQYRTRYQGRDFVAQFINIDRLASSSAWTREADLLGSLRTRHVVRFLRAFELDEYGVILTDLPPGEVLSQRLESGSALDVLTALDVAMHIGVALLSIHMLPPSPVHARLSSHRVRLLHETDETSAVLMNYGCATGLRTPLHHPEYFNMLDERDRPKPSDDVFSLGCLLFEMLTNVSPARGRLDDDIADMADSPLSAPSSFRPELRSIPGLDALVGDLTGTGRSRITSIADATNRIEQVRVAIQAQPGHVRRARPSSGARLPIASDTMPSAARTQGSIEGLESDILRLQARLDSTIHCLWNSDDRLWYGTNAGELGVLEFDSGEVRTVAEASTAIAFVHGSPTCVAGATEDHELVVAFENRVERVQGPQPIEALSVAHDVPRVAVARADGQVTVFEFGTRVRELCTCQRSPGGLVALSANGEMLQIEDDGSTAVFEVAGGNEVARFTAAGGSAPPGTEPVRKSSPAQRTRED